jgi:hypothetical protein
MPKSSLLLQPQIVRLLAVSVAARTVPHHHELLPCAPLADPLILSSGAQKEC